MVSDPAVVNSSVRSRKAISWSEGETKMDHGALRDAQRIASSYANDLAYEYDAWKRDHAVTMDCRDWEERITYFNSILRAVLTFESKRRAEITEGEGPPDQEIESRRALGLRNLLNPCAKVREIIDWFQSQEYGVDGASEFRSLCTGIEMMIRTSELPSNPRPVHIDEHGNIFEITGEPVVVPGLKPDQVQKGIAEAQAGMGRPLRNIVAERQNALRSQTPG
jgi:hypothetical protein